jgi:hypothetical protein
MKRITKCTNLGPGPVQKEDNHKNAKRDSHLKVFSSRTTEPEKLRFT